MLLMHRVLQACVCSTFTGRVNTITFRRVLNHLLEFDPARVVNPSSFISSAENHLILEKFTTYCGQIKNEKNNLMGVFRKMKMGLFCD